MFHPLPFDAEVARVYGWIYAAVVAAGRKPRRRVVDWMIAATAVAARAPLYTRNLSDVEGLDSLLEIVDVSDHAAIEGLIAS